MIARRPSSPTIALFCGLLAAGWAPVRAGDPAPDFKTNRPGILGLVGFDQKLGAQVPPDLHFRDEQGRDVRLGDLFGHGKPVLLNLVYFDCPLLCNQVLDSTVRSLNVIKFKVGEEFDVVSVSINPADTPESAARKEGMVLGQYTTGGAKARQGWHFLTGDEASITALAKSVGFRFTYNAANKQFAHPAGILFLTPEGKVSRYIYGLSFPARDLTLSLAEASEGKVGSLAEQAMLLCYVYDPESGSYSFAIMSVIQVLGTITFLILVGYIALMLRRDRRLRRLAARFPGPGPFASDTPPVATN